jgi:hypothetical protein
MGGLFAQIVALAALGTIGRPAVVAAQPGTVSGTATEDGFAVAGARVTLFTPGLGQFLEQRTGAMGEYRFAAVPPGSYLLGVAALGREYQEQAVAVGEAPLEVNFALGPEVEPGRWDVIGNTLPEFFDATDIAVLLADGRIFFCHDTMDPLLYDPVANKKVFPAPSGKEQGCMNASLLADGRLLMAGGQEGSAPGNFKLAVPWVKTYDPATDQWKNLPDMQLDEGRWYTGMARLADGSLLVMGGGTRPDAERTDTCERFDLATNEWSFTGSMLAPTEFPPSALLHTGEVLMTWYPPQLYDPTSGEWRATGNFVQPVRLWPGHSDHSIVVMADGRVAALGIRKGPAGNSQMGEIYDPESETWSLTSNPALLREQAEVAQLPDGRILVAGGDTQSANPGVPSVLGIVKWSDLYDPAVDSWRRVADLNRFAEYHAVTVLIPDGRVVTTGGTTIKFQYGPTSADIEAFSPPYLFRGVRPQITVADASAARGGAIDFGVFPATSLTSVVVMGVQSHTHWVDAGVQRRLVLPVEQDGGTAKLTLPSDPNVLPLGHYILFAMVDDIPSNGVVVRVDACIGDFNVDGLLDIDDFVAFQTFFAVGDPSADCDANGTLDVDDFVCFQTYFAVGC